MKKLLISILQVAVFFLLTSCIMVSKDKIYATSPVGDELLSINRAKEVGIIGQDEYLQLRKQIMDRALAKEEE